MDGNFLGWTIRKYRFTAIKVIICRERKDIDTPRMAWNLHMNSPRDHWTVIREITVKGIQKRAIRISAIARLMTYALVMVRRRGFRRTTANTREFPMTDKSITIITKIDFVIRRAKVLTSISMAGIRAFWTSKLNRTAKVLNNISPTKFHSRILHKLHKC